MSNNAATTVTTNILPVQALYDPTTLAFITFIGPAGLPFTSAAGGVSSVDVSGGTTGLTTTGGPIVSSGTITLGGTLAVTNGGTGSTTATGAINNLLPSQATHAGKYLTTDGTNTSWSTSGANLSVVNDTSTNATRYLTFTDVNTGVITQEYVSSSKLTYNPSSGTVTATTFVGALTGNASTATLAASSTNIAGGANGFLPYQTGSGTTTFLAAGSNGQFLTLSGGVPTWSSLSYVSSFSAGTTGFTPNVSTTGAVTLSGTLNVANGGTGVTSSSGANSVVLRDANVNISANDFYEGFTSVAAAGTTTVMTAASTPNYYLTGSGGQTFQLPDATTLPLGAMFTFNNNQSSGTIVVKNNSSTTVLTVQSGAFGEIILVANSNAAGSWDTHFQAPSNVSWSTNTLSYAGSITNATWNGVSIGAIYGGTGQTSYTTGDTLYASASNTLSKLAIGSTGQVLTVSGGVPTWANTSSATTITDDTTTNATRYINFTSATSGSLTNIGTSSTKLQYNPSTGALTSTSLTPTNALGTAYGGTGLTSFTANGVVYASSTSALATGSNLVFDGTNLAVGTTSTSNASLTVNNVNLTSPLYIGSQSDSLSWGGFFVNGATSSTAGNGMYGKSGASLYFNCASSYSHIWTINGGEKMRLNSSGYLGIGTSSPSTPLHIYTTTATSKITLADSTVGSGYGGVLYGYGVAGTGGYMEIGVTDGSASYTKGIRVTQQATSIQFFTGASSVSNTEIARFDSSGNLGIGTTSPNSKLDVSNIGTNTSVSMRLTSNDSGGNSVRFVTTQNADGSVTLNSNQGNNGSTTAMIFQQASTERMRIDSSGNLLIGCTSAGVGYASQGIIFEPAGYESVNHASGTSSGSAYIAFGYNSAGIGSITQNGTTGVLYNTSSDQRLKTNIVDAPAGNIDQIKIRSFDWKSDGSHNTYGVIAQELLEVAPYAVHVPTNPDEMMGVDYSKLVPMMIKEIQSLKAEVATLKGA